jgi:hypothetical protein
MQQELKTVLDAIVNGEMSKDQNFEKQLNEWLKTFGLPGILSSITASDDVPDSIW